MSTIHQYDRMNDEDLGSGIYAEGEGVQVDYAAKIKKERAFIEKHSDYRYECNQARVRIAYYEKRMQADRDWHELYRMHLRRQSKFFVVVDPFSLVTTA